MDRVGIFESHFPAKFLRDVLTGVFESYLSAGEFCADHFQPHEAANVLPFYRRSQIENLLFETGTRFRKQGGQVIVDQDDSGFWFHRIVVFGGAMLTQSTVTHPDEIVRHSLAREMYAEPDNQKYIKGLEPSSKSRNGLVYGLLIHGKEPRERFFPAFAQIVFPNPKLTSYFQLRIDLFKQFPDVVAQCTSGIFRERRGMLKEKFEEITVPEPELRTDIKANEFRKEAQ